MHDIGIDAIASIMPIPMTLQEAVDDGERLLIEAAERFMRAACSHEMWSKQHA